MNEEIELTPQVRQQLAASFAAPEATQRRFRAWFADVLEPLGIERELGWQLFTGKISSLEFAEQLDDTTADRFIEEFPALQARHQARLDRGEVL